MILVADSVQTSVLDFSLTSEPGKMALESIH